MASFTKQSVIFYFFLNFCLVKELSGHPTYEDANGTSKSRFTIGSEHVSQQEAGITCKGTGKVLALIETMELRDELKDILRYSADGHKGFWVDARYDPSKQTFVWQNSGQPVAIKPEDQPTINDELLQGFDESTGLLAKYQGAELKYISAPVNEKHKYICQASPNEVPACSSWGCSLN